MRLSEKLRIDIDNVAKSDFLYDDTGSWLPILL